MGTGAVSLTTRLIRADDSAWDESLVRVPRDIYHLAGYHSFSSARGEGEPYLAVIADGRRGLAWPYLLRKVAEIPELVGSDATDVSSVYGYPGPLGWGCAPGDPFLVLAWEQLTRVWREQGAVTAFTRFHPLLGNAALLSGLPRLGNGEDDPDPVAVGSTVSIDCTLDDDTAWALYARALRQHIRAGRGAGLTTIHDESWSHLAEFTRLYQETMVRNGAAERYFFDEAYFAGLRDALAGHAHLLVTKVGDAIGAAGIFTELGGIVQAHLVGMNWELRSLSPFKVLLDDARRWARERGDPVLHLGGGRGGQQDSLLRFKAEFSRRRHEFCVGRWILDPAAYRNLVAARPDVTGPDVSYFPAYRAVPGEQDSEAGLPGQ